MSGAAINSRNKIHRLVFTRWTGPPAMLQDASNEVKAAAEAGKCWDAGEKEVTLSKYANWPNYAQAKPFVIQRYCALWGRGF
jgi:hypothetical protein